jgi:hypothetical protein
MLGWGDYEGVGRGSVLRGEHEVGAYGVSGRCKSSKAVRPTRGRRRQQGIIKRCDEGMYKMGKEEKGTYSKLAIQLPTPPPKVLQV